ncbi:MAG: 2-hydroxyacid dehydrogenase [Shimia sp.]
MTLGVLFAATPARWTEYEAPLRAAVAAEGLTVDLAPEMAPERVDYIVYAPNSPVQDFAPFTRLKAVLNLWAGVEDVVDNSTLTVPLCRMVDPGLTEGMVEYVTGHVLRHHLGMDAHIVNPGRAWRADPPPLARERRVSILGLGMLGAACAQALRALNFDVRGWSRSPKGLSEITCLSGDAGLREALTGAQIVVLLLPHTPATAAILDSRTLALLPPGAVIVNPGRGALIDDTALLAALDTGQVGHATLDVFREEPLPDDHRYWRHPKVTVTPHIASTTRPETASERIAENIARSEAGRPLIGLVDRSAGY